MIFFFFFLIPTLTDVVFQTIFVDDVVGPFFSVFGQTLMKSLLL